LRVSLVAAAVVVFEVEVATRAFRARESGWVEVLVRVVNVSVDIFVSVERVVVAVRALECVAWRFHS
jgi:hypothetical protein